MRRRRSFATFAADGAICLRPLERTVFDPARIAGGVESCLDRAGLPVPAPRVQPARVTSRRRSAATERFSRLCRFGPVTRLPDESAAATSNGTGYNAMNKLFRGTVMAAVLATGTATAFGQGGGGGAAGGPGGGGAGGSVRGGAGGGAGGPGGAERGGPVGGAGGAMKGGEVGGPAERGGPAVGAEPRGSGGAAGRGPGRDGGGAPERGGRDAGGRGDREGLRDGRGDRDGPGLRGDREGPGARGERDGRPDRGVRGERGEARGAFGRLGGSERSRFRQDLFRSSVPRLAAGAFALTVGTAIDRSYTLHRLPPDIVDLAPEYEDYSYVLVDDDIVDPNTYEIVDVIRS